MIRNTGRVEGLLQLCSADIVVVFTDGDFVEPGQIIQHSQQIEGFRIPFLFVVGSNLVAFQKLHEEGNVPQILEHMTGVALEQLKGGAIAFFIQLLHSRCDQALHRDIQNSGNAVNRFRRAYLLDPDRTNVDVKVQYYEVALLSLIKTVEQNLLSYEVQSSADETMTTFDYLIEGAGAAAFLAGLPEGDAVVKGVQTLISSVSGSISILDECLNTLESDDDWAVLEKMWITYDNVERILAAIEDYPHAEGDETMGYLKYAARNLRTGMKYSLLANLNNFNEFLGKTTEEIGSFVFSDVLETVTEQEMKVVAPAMQATDWECLRLVSKAAKFI